MSEAARFFQALGDETRLSLLLLLRRGEKTVTQLVDALGCPQPKVSRHLGVLKSVGLVRDRRAGRHVHYELAVPAGWEKEARRWVALLDAGLAPPDILSEVSRAKRRRRSSSRKPAPRTKPLEGPAKPTPVAMKPAPPRKADASDMETFLL